MGLRGTRTEKSWTLRYSLRRAGKDTVPASGCLLHFLLPVKLLQRIRDESHRFAVSYHSILKGKRQTTSLLDDVPGVGPMTRKKLLKTFGSVRGLLQAPQAEIEQLIGDKKAAVLQQYLQAHKPPVV